MKGPASIVITNFIRWKQEGWQPARDLILALTADEELYGDENGVAWLMKNHRGLIDAEYALNPDGGDFETRGGKPFSAAVTAGEKKETILHLETRNRGGHGFLDTVGAASASTSATLEHHQQRHRQPSLRG